MEEIMKPARLLFALIVFFSCAGQGLASDAQLKEGNRLFRKGRYPEALKKYNDALIDAPESVILRFNAGGAAYQSGDFSSAEKQFQETAEKTPHPEFRAAARYNQGNALFRQHKLAEAVEAYKESLRANPRDEDAKYNLGVAMNALKNPQSPQQKPGSGKKKSDDKQDSRPAQPKPGEMSKEDAERLMSAVGAGEPRKPANAKKGDAPHPDEDW